MPVSAGSSIAPDSLSYSLIDRLILIQSANRIHRLTSANWRRLKHRRYNELRYYEPDGVLGFTRISVLGRVMIGRNACFRV